MHHKARAFFYVCGGLFLLTAAFELGARNARAQAGFAQHLEGANLPEGIGVASGVIGRTFHTSRASFSIPDVPGTAPVVATWSNGCQSCNGGANARALLDNGDLYAFIVSSTDTTGSGSGSWAYLGNIVGSGGTPVTRATLGQVKAHWFDRVPASGNSRARAVTPGNR
jgi:hypothetical protein